MAQFGDGINMVLHRWAALRMAVENEWGGRDSLQKAQQLGHNLFNFLSQSRGIFHNSRSLLLRDQESLLRDCMFRAVNYGNRIQDSSNLLCGYHA